MPSVSKYLLDNLHFCTTQLAQNDSYHNDENITKRNHDITYTPDKSYIYEVTWAISISELALLQSISYINPEKSNRATPTCKDNWKFYETVQPINTKDITGCFVTKPLCTIPVCHQAYPKVSDINYARS